MLVHISGVYQGSQTCVLKNKVFCTSGSIYGVRGQKYRGSQKGGVASQPREARKGRKEDAI